MRLLVIFRGEQSHQQSHQQSRAELWECSTCTFHNKQSANICEMCSKSRDFQPPQDIRSVEPAKTSRLRTPPGVGGEESGGVACDKCTLVNPVHSVVCDACGATLPKSKVF